MRGFGKAISEAARQAAAAPFYHHYLNLRERIIDMIVEAEDKGSHPSGYWRRELTAFDYMFDASPLVIRRLREIGGGWGGFAYQLKTLFPGVV